MPTLLTSIFDALAAATGWVFHVSCGGPNPSDHGAIYHDRQVLVLPWTQISSPPSHLVITLGVTLRQGTTSFVHIWVMKKGSKSHLSNTSRTVFVSSSVGIY